MNLRIYSVIALLLLVSSTARAEQPNIVFIIADDCTFRDIGCYGGQAHTPHIDALAEQGMRMTRCFQAAPMCSPTRHNIYTGLYPVRSGAYPNHTRVNPGVKSVVTYLRKLGYRVAQTGKTHVGPAAVFDWEKLGQGKTLAYNKMNNLMAECKTDGKPFCLLVCSNEPHTPWNKGDPSRYPADKIVLPPYFADTAETRADMSRYLAEITYFDGQVGQTLQLLDNNGLANDTLVIVVSEQGSSFPFGKWTCYDTGLQSAFVARWPGHIEPASVNDAMIEYVDILPTFIEVAGGTPAPSLQGKSLLPVFAGATSHKQYVFGEMTTRGINNGSEHFGIRSVRSEKHKLIVNFTPEVPFQCAASDSKTFRSWQAAAEAGDAHAADLVKRYAHRPAIELYDVQADPYEMNNLADDPQLADVRRTLRGELERWMIACGDQGQATERAAYDHMPGRKPKGLFSGPKAQPKP